MASQLVPANDESNLRFSVVSDTSDILKPGEVLAAVSPAQCKVRAD